MKASIDPEAEATVQQGRDAVAQFKAGRAHRREAGAVCRLPLDSVRRMHRIRGRVPAGAAMAR